MFIVTIDNTIYLADKNNVYKFENNQYTNLFPIRKRHILDRLQHFIKNIK